MPRWTQKAWLGYWLGPGNTNVGMPGGCWVGTRYSTLPLPTHPYTSWVVPLPYTLPVHVRHAGTDCHDTRFEHDQGDPRVDNAPVYARLQSEPGLPNAVLARARPQGACLRYLGYLRPGG